MIVIGALSISISMLVFEIWIGNRIIGVFSIGWKLINNAHLLQTQLILFTRIQMIERLWRSKTVTQPQAPEAQNQNLNPNPKELHLPNSIGCKIIEMQMQIEQGNLTKNLLIELLQQYTKAVEFYEEKGDQRYRLYQRKITNFLMKEAVDAVLKGRENAGTMIIKREKVEGEIRKATNNSKTEVKKLLENSQLGAQKQKNKIQNEMTRQMLSLQKRLEKKRSNSHYLKGKNTSACQNAKDSQDLNLKVKLINDLPNIPRPKRQSIVRF